MAMLISMLTPAGEAGNGSGAPEGAVAPAASEGAASEGGNDGEGGSSDTSGDFSTDAITDLLSIDGGEDTVVSAPVAPAAKGTEEVAPGVRKAPSATDGAAPAVAVVPAVVPVKPGEAPAAAAPAPAHLTQPSPAASSAAPLTLEQIRENFQTQRNAMQTELASTHYALTDDQKRRLDEGDASFIPEMMARVYMDSVTGTVAHITQHLPALIQQVLAGQAQTKTLEDKFFEANSHFNRSDNTHVQTIFNFGRQWRAMNPAGTAEEFIRDVGAQASVALRLTPKAMAAANAAAPAASRPFRPAGTGTRGGAGPAPAVDNPFAAMAEQLLADDTGGAD